MSILSSIRQQIRSRLTEQVLTVEVIVPKETEDVSNFLFHALLLEYKKGNITILRQIVCQGLDHFIEQVGSTMPAGVKTLLTINGDKILNKTIEKKQGKDFEPDIHLKEALPGIAPEQFYTQVYDPGGTNYFVSLIRKNYLEDLLNQLKSISASVISLSVGPHPVFSIYPLVFPADEAQAHNVSFCNYDFIFRQTDLEHARIAPYVRDVIQQYNRELPVDTELIPERLLIAYAAGVDYFSTGVPPGIKDHTQSNDRYAGYIFTRYSKPLLQISAVILLLTLIVSSVLFTVYTDKLSMLQQQHETGTRHWQHIRDEQETFKKREEMLTSAGLTGTGQIAIYADQITRILPEDVYLLRLQMHPPQRKQSHEGNMAFVHDQILVHGNCYTNEALNTWMHELSQMKWIKQVTLKEYKQNAAGELGTFVMEIIQKK